MNAESFIERSVAFQLGGALGQKLEVSAQTRAAALEGSSGAALAWNAAKERPYRANGWRFEQNAQGETTVHNTHKFVSSEKQHGALKALLASGMSHDFIVDMQDRRLRNLRLPDGRLHPVFCFNRTHQDQSRILWPLPGYHDIDSLAFLGEPQNAEIPWFERRPTIAWRGNLSGRADWHGDVRREGLRLKPLIKKFRQGALTKEQVENNLRAFPRHRLVSRYMKDPRFDIGFTGAEGVDLDTLPMMRPYQRDRIAQSALSKNRFLLVLRGMDVGSSFYWMMNSGSLALVMEGPFETFASCHFTPWEHYVPFRADLSDFEERIEWCLQNDGACEDMARRARQTCQYLARKDLRLDIAKQIAERIHHHLRRA